MPIQRGQPAALRSITSVGSRWPSFVRLDFMPHLRVGPVSALRYLGPGQVFFMAQRRD